MKLKSYQTLILLTYVLIILCMSIEPIILFQNQWKYDKYIHFIEYFFLGFLFINAIEVKLTILNKVSIFLCLITFSLVDEGLQYFSPRRISSINDIIVDNLGSTMGACLRYFMQNFWIKND